MSYHVVRHENGAYEAFERWPFEPAKGCTFALDTETITRLDGKAYPEDELRAKLVKMKQPEIRKRLSIEVWAWQCYDEVNGFYMTNSFDLFMTHLCACGYKFGWCYNSTFDFAQIDFAILSTGTWKPIEKGKGGAYSKAQPYAYESIHNDTGTRYAYKLWYPYRNPRNRHKMVHSVEFRDMMKFCTGGLKKLLSDLEITEADGVTPIRKLTMDYQAIDVDNITAAQLAYCRNDVAGLYFAVKKFNGIIEARSGGECHIFGPDTNLMTAGGFAKKQLLRSLYPNKAPKDRLAEYQRAHPSPLKLDEFLRSHHLYRGGITYLNPAYKGKAVKGPLYRYDVNSEYPYAMSEIPDLLGMPFKTSLSSWLAQPAAEREKYEAAYMLTDIAGDVRPGMLGVWYDPARADFVTRVDEPGPRLMFERELNEMAYWYDLDYSVAYVVLWRRGPQAYRPFVLQNYGNKSEAKNKTEKQEAKLELNSSYGKLSERLIRGRGHYEISPDTGAVHFVHDGEEEDAGGAMSVAVGSLVTAFARCYILSKIREICPNPEKDFVYIDTDSIHCFKEYAGCDAKRLGALKCEAICPAAKYIAPKTYVDILDIRPNGSVPFGPEGVGFEVHSKGVNVRAVLDDIAKKQPGKIAGEPTPELLYSKMEYGAKYPVLMAMNVRGGKALVPTYKYLARPETAPAGFASSNVGGLNMLLEA